MSEITSKEELYTPAGSRLEAYRGDYLGFTYNGIHSSFLGIVRVSSSNRYDEGLLPTMSDKTTQIPGADGTYYFGSHYTQRTFSINIAFDHMHDYQLRNLKVLFGDRKPHKLIFDENPYKVYYAKVTGSPALKHLAFDYEGDKRIYRGEGTISFTCHYPFAASRYKYLTDYATPIYTDEVITGWTPNYENIPEWFGDYTYFNLPEWIDGSGIKEEHYRGEGLFYADLEGELTQATPEESFQINDDPNAEGAEASRVAGSVYTPDLMPEPEDSVPGYIVVNPEDGVVVDGTSGFVALSDYTLEHIYEHVADTYSFDWTSFLVVHSELAHLADSGEGTYMVTYNPGDVPTDWVLYLMPTEFDEQSRNLRVALPNKIPAGIIGSYKTGEALIFTDIILNTVTDHHVGFNSKTHMIEGYDSYNQKTGTVYNAAVIGGSFFQIPVGVDQFFMAGFGVDQTTTRQSWDLMGNYLDYSYLYY